MKKTEYYENILADSISKTAEAAVLEDVIIKQASLAGGIRAAKTIGGLAGLGGAGYLGYKATNG